MAGKHRHLDTRCLAKVHTIVWNPKGFPTRSMENMKWNSPSQVPTTKHVSYTRSWPQQGPWGAPAKCTGWTFWLYAPLDAVDLEGPQIGIGTPPGVPEVTWPLPGSHGTRMWQTVQHKRNCLNTRKMLQISRLAVYHLKVVLGGYHRNSFRVKVKLIFASF